MFVHILIGLTKEDKLNNTHNTYIRLLGFNTNGKKYIKSQLLIDIVFSG